MKPSYLVPLLARLNLTEGQDTAKSNYPSLLHLSTSLSSDQGQCLPVIAKHVFCLQRASSFMLSCTALLEGFLSADVLAS